MGLVKTTYHLIAGLALLHFLAIVGIAGYFLATGRVDPERLQEAITDADDGHPAQSHRAAQRATTR